MNTVHSNTPQHLKKMATGQEDEFEYEFVKELPKELTCSICVKVLRLPHLMNCCEQPFCKECLEKWLEKNKTCPHCHSADYSHMLMKQKSRKVGELKVYCLNKKHGCESILEINEFDNHLSTTNAVGCLYVELSCPNMCISKVFRGEMERHIEKQCPKRQVFCAHCEIQGEHQFVVGDHVNTCPSYPLDCPQKCGATVPRKDLDTHREICPLEIVPCLYSELGCKVQVCRKDLERHMESSVLQHMTELANSHLTLKAEHGKLEAEHAVLKAENAELKKRYAEIDGRLNATGTIVQRLPNHIKLLKKNCDIHRQISDQVAKVYPLLVETSEVAMHTPLVLSLSETNTKSGHHYLKLSAYKFKLEWELDQDSHTEAPPTQEAANGAHTKAPKSDLFHLKVYLVMDDLHPALPETWSAEIEIRFLSQTTQAADEKMEKIAVICCGVSQTMKQAPSNTSLQLLGMKDYLCNTPKHELKIKFNDHTMWTCKRCIERWRDHAEDERYVKIVQKVKDT